MVVADEEDGAAVSVHLVVIDQRATERERHGVAVVVDGAAAAAVAVIAAATERLVVGKMAVQDVPGDPDAAQRAAVGAAIAVALGTAECAVDDPDRQPLILTEDAHRSSAQVRP